MGTLAGEAQYPLSAMHCHFEANGGLVDDKGG
jgi:hypothetical protein